MVEKARQPMFESARPPMAEGLQSAATLRRRLPLLLLALLGLAGLFAVVQLFRLRFAAGDLYPPYSSLRADPLGAKALHDSLAELPGFTVERARRPLGELTELPTATWFNLGNDPFMIYQYQGADAIALHAFVARGGRVVIALRPESEPSWLAGIDQQVKPEKSAPDEKKESAPDKKKDADVITWSPAMQGPEGEESWGFKVDYALPAAPPVTASRMDLSAGEPQLLPPELPVHGAVYFSKLSPDWKPVYAAGDRVYVMQREMGAGTIILLADGYWFSNEALLSERQAGLIAWLVGENRRVIFDEHHFGVAESPGVVSLARRYRLEGLIAGLLLLAALFIWKNATRLVPPQPDTADAAARVEGREAAAGLVSLLRRAVPEKLLIATCLEQWRKAGRAGGIDPARLHRLEAVAAESGGKPLERYNRLQTLLHEKKRVSQD